MPFSRLALASLLLASAFPTSADTRSTPTARAEIEKHGASYPGAEFATLKTLYKTYLQQAGFPRSKAVRDVAYGPDGRHRLDILKPTTANATGMPVLVFVHGGAFVRGERSDGAIFDNVLDYFTRHGVLGINATYRLAPDHQWPAAAEDLASALAWVRAHAADHGGDPEKIFLMGHSAGAVHVASYVFMEELHPPDGDGVRGAILLSGVYGAETATADSHVYFGEATTLAQRAPLAHVPGRAVPLFVIDAEYDPLVMQQSSLNLMSAVCERDGRCPRHQQIRGHNHYSMTYHINTRDDSIAGDILSFITDLSDEP